MELKTRKIIFNIFVAVFFIIGAYLLITAQGFVIDFKNFKFMKTGAIFLKFEPGDAEIFLNGKIYPASKNLINNGILIKNLPPSKYKITLRKNGYHEWIKELTVESGFVSRESQVKLWSIEPKYKLITKKTDDFFLTDEGVIYERIKGKLRFNDADLKGDKIILSDVSSNYVITASGESDYFWIDLANPATAINLTELFYSLRERKLLLKGRVPIEKIIFHPVNRGAVIIATQNAVYSLDPRKIDLEQLVALKNLSVLGVSQNELFLTDSSQKIIVLNLVLKTKTTLSKPAHSIVDLKIGKDSNIFFLLNLGSELMEYDREREKIETIAGNVKEFYLSPEEKRLAVITKDNELKIIYLESYEGDIKEERGASLKINLPNEKTLSFFNWLVNAQNYFLILAGNDLLAGEIDKRPPFNFFTFKGGIKKILLNEKELYLLKTSGELEKLNLDF